MRPPWRRSRSSITCFRRKSSFCSTRQRARSCISGSASRIDGEQADACAKGEMMMRVIRHVLAAAALVSAAVVFPAAANATDKVCKLAITGTDLMQYDKKELDVA